MKYKCDLSHSVWQEPGGFGAIIEKCALGKILVACGKELEGGEVWVDLCNIFAVSEIAEDLKPIYALNDQYPHSQENHDKAVRMALEAALAGGNVEFVYNGEPIEKLPEVLCAYSCP